MNIFFLEFFFNIDTFYRRPFQINLRSWINKLRSKCKCINISNCTINRILCNISNLILCCQCSCKNPCKKLCFIHSRIICPYILMRCIERAVKNLYIRMCNRHLYTCYCHCRRCDKYKVCTIFYHHLNSMLIIFFRLDISNAYRLYLLTKCIIYILSSKFMCITPFRILWCIFIYKSHFQFLASAVWPRKEITQNVFLRLIYSRVHL